MICGGAERFSAALFEEVSEPEQKLTRLLLDRKTYLDLQAQNGQCSRHSRKPGSRFLRWTRGCTRHFPGISRETYRDGFTGAARRAAGVSGASGAGAAHERRTREALQKSYWGNTKNIAGISAPILPGSAAGGFARGRADAIEGALRMADAPKKKGAAGRAERRKPGAFAGADGSIRAALSRYQALDETRTLRECTQALCRRFAQYTLSSARAERYFCRQQAGTGTKKRRRRRN